jgi:hypothetical protein
VGRAERTVRTAVAREAEEIYPMGERSGAPDQV